MFREESKNQHSENGKDKIYFQIPETSHHHGKSICIGVLVKIPVPEILPLRNIRNILRNILRPESGVEVFHPVQSKNIQSENFKKIVEEEEESHKNHVSNLQLEQPIQGFFDISARS